jgi:hypothetical protein
MKLGELDRAITTVDQWRAEQTRLDNAERDLVLDLRGRGASWDSIGWLVGVTGEAVRQRFGSDDLCACGKPRSHLSADPDSEDWACRVPG